jgi:hypothetical protein
LPAWIREKRPSRYPETIIPEKFRKLAAESWLEYRIFAAGTLAFALNYYRGWLSPRKETKINYARGSFLADFGGGVAGGARRSPPSSKDSFCDPPAWILVIIEK